MSKDILFVFGAARSGTTYVARVLEDLFDFGMGPEGHFIVDTYTKLKSYGSLEKEENLTKLLLDIHGSSTLKFMRERWKEHERVDISLADLRRFVHGTTYPVVVSGVLEAIATGMGKSRLGTKNPEFSLHLENLHDMFGERALYLHVIRDGRDVALSSMQLPWGQNSFYACGKDWAKYVREAKNFEAKFNPRKYLNVFYEQLLQDPVAELTKIRDFLGSDLSDTCLRQAGKSMANDSYTNNFFKWKTKMSESELRCYEAVAGDELMSLGYDTSYTNPRLPMVKRIGYEVEEYMRKVKVTLGNDGRAN